VCIAEENFCSEFFHFPKVEQQQLEVTNQDEQEEEVHSLWCGVDRAGRQGRQSPGLGGP